MRVHVYVCGISQLVQGIYYLLFVNSRFYFHSEVVLTNTKHFVMVSGTIKTTYSILLMSQLDSWHGHTYTHHGLDMFCLVC